MSKSTGSASPCDLDELRLEVSANLLEHDFEPLDSARVKNLSSIFGDEYKVDHAVRKRNASRDEGARQIWGVMRPPAFALSGVPRNPQSVR